MSVSIRNMSSATQDARTKKSFVQRSAVTLTSYTYTALMKFSRGLCQRLGIEEGIGQTIIDAYVHLMLAASIIPRLKALFSTANFSMEQIQVVFARCSTDMANALYHQLSTKPQQVLMCGWNLATSDKASLASSSQEMLKDTFSGALSVAGKTLNDRLHLTEQLQNWNVADSVVQMIEHTFKEPAIAKGTFFDASCRLASSLYIPQDILQNIVGCEDFASVSATACREIKQHIQVEIGGAAQCIVSNTLNELDLFTKRTTVQMDFFSSEFFQLGVIYILLILLIAVIAGVGRSCRRR